MKYTIALYKAVELKTSLENSINEDNRLLIEANKNNDKDFDFDEIHKLKEEKSNLILKLHMVISECNMKKGKGEKYPNLYYIKIRSELSREKLFLSNLTIGKNTKFKLNEITTRIKLIDQEINSLSNKLTTFNITQTIKLDIDPDIIKKLGISID